MMDGFWPMLTGWPLRSGRNDPGVVLRYRLQRELSARAGDISVADKAQGIEDESRSRDNCIARYV